MTSERAAQLAAARRHGMDPEGAAVQFRFREIALDSPEGAQRAETVSREDGEREDEIIRKFQARQRAAL
jgi:hypothetical protein